MMILLYSIMMAMLLSNTMMVRIILLLSSMIKRMLLLLLLQVVINSAIVKSLKYNQATPTFHQWRDRQGVYGLNFSSQDDADVFAQSFSNVVDSLNGKWRQTRLRRR